MISLSSALRLCSLNANKILFSNARQTVPVYSQSAGLKTLEEKVGLPPRPKKPLTPYFRYMIDRRPGVAAANPTLGAMDVVRLISKQWETVDEKLKQKYLADYQKEKMSYVELRAKYDSKITDAQRNAIKQLKHDLVELKERKALKKRIRDLGKPKKPASAFLRYIVKERANTPQEGGETYRQWHVKATARWARLPEAQKNAYMQEARKEIELYKIEIAKWEEKMVRLGNIDVVRSDTLIDPPEPKSRQKPRSTE